MEIRKKKHALHVNLRFRVIGFGWEPVSCDFYFPPLPVVFKAVRMCQGVLGFDSVAVPRDNVSLSRLLSSTMRKIAEGFSNGIRVANNSQTAVVICLEQPVSAAFSLLSSSSTPGARPSAFLDNLGQACLIFLSPVSYQAHGLVVGLCDQKHLIPSPVISSSISE